MSHLRARPAHLVSGCKDERLAVGACPFDADELKAAPVAVSHVDTDTADRAEAKTHLFDYAEVLSGEPVSLRGSDILNPKTDVSRQIVTLAIQPSMASQQNGG